VHRNNRPRMIIRLAWKQASSYGEASTFQSPPIMNTSCYYLDGLEEKKRRGKKREHAVLFYLQVSKPIRTSVM
jgi:hypothetical protein